MQSSVVLTNDAARSLEKGAFWFSARDIVGRKPKFAGIAKLLDRKKAYRGMAFVSPDSMYFLRVFSMQICQPDTQFWRDRIAAAYKKREALSKLSNAFRVVHAEADGIPAVVIDKYNDIWVIAVSSTGSETIKKILIDVIISDYAPIAVIEKNLSDARKREGLPLVNKFAYGSKQVAQIREGDEIFEVDVMVGQKTGAYLDYRAIRLAAKDLAKGSCLDACCYHGWFACQIASKAKSVVGVDSSRDAINVARKNALTNGHKNIEFVCGDVFDYLKNCDQKFDFIHLDPPAFAKGKSKFNAAALGYTKLIKSALKLISAGGLLFISSCSHAVGLKVLKQIIENVLNKEKILFDFVYSGAQDVDHPIISNHPQSGYLCAVGIRIRS